ncbi:hypothetical protein PTSG_12622 [Salpingoeca rosetta]|uniref:Secreted peptide n=1 Tax=Salpingoeca rosetta (strain ATCC 50818 / BSB-021) TaxID=946362 RepID=F2UHI5_SALR5|nr:uncharacterized protein PTSG_12622 [Salpingoeca rosetta]EGD76584.1 hypothetical protein PTSG_12622 [Salpingoeca rosetta]|eukprot:XP_004991498.1 hypothetical protein PTSG_12622 [Salpingoeca rosetta]
MHASSCAVCFAVLLCVHASRPLVFPITAIEVPLISFPALFIWFTALLHAALLQNLQPAILQALLARMSFASALPCACSHITAFPFVLCAFWFFIFILTRCIL